MTRRELVLEAARCIRSELSRLLPDEDCARLDGALAKILEAAGSTADPDYQILRLTGEYDSTMEWIARFMREYEEPVFDGTRGYSAPPGKSLPVGGAGFRCPLNDFVWFRRSVGAQIPKCPTHGVTLIAARGDTTSEEGDALRD